MASLIIHHVGVPILIKQTVFLSGLSSSAKGTFFCDKTYFHTEAVEPKKTRTYKVNWAKIAKDSAFHH